ncbi:MAG: metal-sensitive transcriptional regulator [Candidatus Contubernalis sp.]|nr:metal-sensitive transcriptional regulator [Candidatus Contubernalis sp.]
MDESKKESLFNRLNRIEGQVKGVSRMIKEEKYCSEVLIQIAAIRSALHSVGVQMIKDHLSHCLDTAIEENRKDEFVEELGELFARYLK